MSQLQELADKYYVTRRLRMDKDKEAAKLKSAEVALKEELIALMKEEKLTVVGGQSVVLRYIKKDKPHPDDWGKIWGHIQSTGDFDLLHKRLTDLAVEERWAEGREIPGIGRFPVEDLSVSPIK